MTVTIQGSDQMELTIQQGDLGFAVGKAMSSISAKSPMPLLSCLLLEADKNVLRVTGTDLELTTAASVPCSIKTSGRAAVSARHFHEVVRKMPRGEIKLAFSGEQVEVRYGDGKGWARFPTQDASDFPRVPDMKPETKITIEGESLAERIARAEVASRQGFVDQNDSLSAGTIAPGEFPAAAERDAHGAKISRGYVSQFRLE